MATLEQCQSAVAALIDRLAAVESELRSRYVVERTVSCSVYDLGVVFTGRLCDDGLRDVTVADSDRAQIRLSVSGDDLLALVDGSLSIPTAWATGRLRVQAGPLDLLRLRQLL